MAEDKHDNENEFSPEEEEFGFGTGDADSFGDSDFGALTGGDADSDFGNLPPLSDFESSAGDDREESDAGLPPLGDITSDMGDEGLPSIEDIDVETPVPTGGNIRPAPVGFERKDFETPLADADIETPEPLHGTGFQDLAADSDFSPETPEIGPGPDSDIDTPMFDSAFGGQQDFEDISDTSSPTQAMATPMFGADEIGGGNRPGFDEGAFGGVDENVFDQGTPIPDFSPDTGVPEQAPLAEAAAGGKKKKQKKAAGPGGGAGTGKVVAIAAVVAIVALIGGVFLNPYVSGYLPVPDPRQQQLQTARDDIQALETRLRRFESIQAGPEGAQISPEEVDRLLERQSELTTANTALEQANQEFLARQEELKLQLATIEEDVEVRRDEARSVQEQLETLRNDTAIQKARQEGLNAEVLRLTEQVGQLEQADARRSATKDALLHNIDRLAVQVREGIPLTPTKYSRDARLQDVLALQSEVQNAKWVTPELLQRYTTLYLRELEIAQAREHFFAKIPTVDRYGSRTEKWAECLMNGNWSVYFRTLDGQDIGIYENTASAGPAVYAFRANLPKEAQVEIEQAVIAHRTEDFERSVQLLAQKGEVIPQPTALQRIFNSL